MKKLLLFLCSVGLVLSISGMAGGTTYTFQPTPSDMSDFNGSYWYTWGIDQTIPEGETIQSASLSFDNISYWNDYYETGDLWVHLLDSAIAGVTDIWSGDPDGDADHFAGQGTFLFDYQDHTRTTNENYSYQFTDLQIAALSGYAGDGNFGFAFDPDCHFFNDGVSFTVETAGAPVPEPTTMLLLGCGLAGLGFVRRKKQIA